MSSIVTRTFVLSCVLSVGACTDAGLEAADPATAAPQSGLLPRAQLSPEQAQAAAALTGTLSCHLDYMRASPFAISSVASFTELMSVVASQGVTRISGGLGLYAIVNPTPPANLSFDVGAYHTSTGRTVLYNVLPPPTPSGAFLFENGAEIPPVTIGGIAYDYLRVYCSLTP